MTPPAPQTPAAPRPSGFQGALRQASTRFGAGLGLDAVQMVLANLAANPATASQVPRLRHQLALARTSIAGGPR